MDVFKGLTIFFGITSVIGLVLTIYYRHKARKSEKKIEEMIAINESSRRATAISKGANSSVLEARVAPHDSIPREGKREKRQRGWLIAGITGAILMGLATMVGGAAVRIARYGPEYLSPWIVMGAAFFGVAVFLYVVLSRGKKPR